MKKANIVGKYEFKIWKDGKYYLAQSKVIAGVKSGGLITQGRNQREIFEMLADAYMTIFDIPIKKNHHAKDK